MIVWEVRPLMEVAPLKLGMVELARRNGICTNKTELALAIKGNGTLWRAMDCVERIISAGYAETVVVRKDDGRAQRFELRMTEEGWKAARRMGIEEW